MLAGLEIIGDYITVDFRESDAAAAQPLHDESFAAEQARAESFAEMDRQLDAHFRGEERAFLQNQILTGLDVHGEDLAGKARAERDGAFSTGGVDVLEQVLTGERFGEHASDSTGPSLHLHVRRHPHHGSAFGDHLLTIGESACDDGECSTADLVSHSALSLLSPVFCRSCRARRLRHFSHGSPADSFSLSQFYNYNDSNPSHGLSDGMAMSLNKCSQCSLILR